MVRVKEEYDVVASPSFFNGSCDSYPKKSLSTLSYSSRRAIGPIRHSTRGRWTKEEDRFLIAAVQKFNCKNWKTIGRCDSFLHLPQDLLDFLHKELLVLYFGGAGPSRDT
ncbi:uncharacterized protein LOC120292688 [Eucalyptus grandis]|uniref:uncharacterized protein LOC120292688 n=1 Tax=Eucalyptus grandis TaxID=71139 RepID=UPI00192E9C6D|nr:uncharacterized protein LOC120292688 [Eucalyptus grandis]